MTDEHLDGAYATLGLTHDASLNAVKHEYEALVAKWHPDRFIGDPQGVAEATLMLRAVNHAYRVILEDRLPHAFGQLDAHWEARANRIADASVSHLHDAETIEAIRHSESLLAIVFDDDYSGWRSRVASLIVTLIYVVVGWRSGDAVRPLVFCLSPLFCIWFPDVLGSAIHGRITRPSPPSFVWFFGWALLLLPLLFLPGRLLGWF